MAADARTEKARYASVFRTDALADRVVLVTGGGTGLGRCIAHEVAALGAIAVLAGRRPEPLAHTAEEIRDAGGRADVVPFNIRDADAVAAGVAGIVGRHGRVDGLVNNAGGQFAAGAADISPNGWRSVVDLNLNGMFQVTREVFHSSMVHHGGAVVSVTADMWNGMPSRAHSGAARAGVVNLTKTLAVEWAPYRVRVNGVAPGMIFSTVMDDYPVAHQRTVQERARRIPAGRLGTESELSAAVVFLLTDAAAFINGETLRVDGGGSLTPEPPEPLPAGEWAPPFNGFHLAKQPVPASRQGGE
jgi:citronellol/citronellal dehydrogenase